MSGQSEVIGSFGTALRQSTFLRLLVLALLTLVLLLPVDWIRELIAERSQRQNDASEEIVGKWGRAQTLAGPVLIVPYQRRRTEKNYEGKDVEKVEQRYLTVLPDVLRVRAKVDGQERHRGIFVVPVYRLSLDVSGEMSLPDLKALDIEANELQWQRARVVVGVSDARTIQNRASLTWNGAELPFRAGPGDIEAVSAGVHAPLDAAFQGRAEFAFRLTMQGSSSLFFTPLGQETEVAVESNWPTPSFQGDWLPAERSVVASGCTATWQIPFLGRSQAQAWTTAVFEKARCLETSLFGVDLLLPVSAYRMADRSVKYAQLFILLTFGTIWLLEVLGRLRVHPIQYLLIGGALCTFYLLELSLSEQLGFAIAYLLASAAVVVLIGAYAAIALRGWRRSLAVTSMVGGLYCYLYVLLTNEDYALLMGSLGLFIALASAMLLTRNVNWYAPSQPLAASAE